MNFTVNSTNMLVRSLVDDVRAGRTAPYHLAPFLTRAPAAGPQVDVPTALQELASIRTRLEALRGEVCSCEDPYHLRHPTQVQMRFVSRTPEHLWCAWCSRCDVFLVLMEGFLDGCACEHAWGHHLGRSVVSLGWGNRSAASDSQLGPYHRLAQAWARIPPAPLFRPECLLCRSAPTHLILWLNRTTTDDNPRGRRYNYWPIGHWDSVEDVPTEWRRLHLASLLRDFPACTRVCYSPPGVASRSHAHYHALSHGSCRSTCTVMWAHGQSIPEDPLAPHFESWAGKYCGRDGLVACHRHDNGAIIGESGPDEGVTGPIGGCGCSPAAPGNHVVNWSQVAVRRIGYEWWVDGRSHRGSKRQLLLGALLGTGPLRRATISVPVNRQPGWVTDTIIGLINSIAPGRIPATHREELSHALEYIEGTDGVDAEQGSTMSTLFWRYLRIFASATPVEDPLPGVAAMAFRGAFYADRFMLASPLIFESGDMCPTPPVSRPPGTCVELEEDLRPAPYNGGPLIQPLGVVMCRRHHLAHQVPNCGPWASSVPPCNCVLFTGMHVIGNCVVLVWGETWHLPRGANISDTNAFVRAGFSQVGTPWWDGVTRGDDDTVYNVNRGETTPFSGQPLTAYDVFFGAGPYEGYGNLGIAQLHLPTPPGLTRASIQQGSDFRMPSRIYY